MMMACSRGSLRASPARLVAGGCAFERSLARRRPGLAIGSRRTVGGSSAAGPARGSAGGRAPASPRPGLLLGIGVLGGFSGSLVGLGGGFVVIPLLTGLARLSQHHAHAVSLCGVAATSLGSSVAFSSHGCVDWVAALPLATGALVTAALGARFSQRLDGKRLKRALGVLMICVAPMIPLKDDVLSGIRAWKQEAARAEAGVGSEPVAADAAEAQRDWRVAALPVLALGAFTGFCSGLFGVGGGSIMMPGLALVSDLPHHALLGTSLAAMLLPSVVGAAAHYRLGHIAPRLAAPVALGTLAGSFVGAEVATMLPERELKIFFGVFLGALGLRTAMP